MESSPLAVVVAGGGVAGLETLLALRDLAGDRVELTLIAHEDEFVYRPLSVEAPFAVGRVHSVELEQAARDCGAAFVAATVEEVDPSTRRVGLSIGKRMTYDALVL